MIHFKEIVSTLRGCKSLLINNGLGNSPIDSMIGKTLLNLTTDFFGKKMTFIRPKTIGVTPLQCVAGAEGFRTNEHTFEYESMGTDGEKVPLTKYNSTFLFDDQDSDVSYRRLVESEFRAKFEKAILKGRFGVHYLQFFEHAKVYLPPTDN